jgi:acyl carrier protein
MLDIPNVSRTDRIDTIVRQFVKNGGAKAIAPDDDLEALGLTSLDMVNLMLAVEAEFDLTIPATKLAPKNFRSVRNIEGLVSELLH